MGKQYTLEAEVTENHIHHAKWASWHKPDDERRDPIVTAIRDAGGEDVRVEFHVNLIPPNHNWAIWLNGKRYQMTYAMLHYYDDYRIHNGDRNERAMIQFCDDSMTVDVLRLPPDNRPEWEKRGMTYHEYREKVVLGGVKPKPLTPLWMQQDSFPDWLKAKMIKSPQDAELQRIIARHKESEGDGE